MIAKSALSAEYKWKQLEESYNGFPAGWEGDLW